ncbi:hypothetical protein Taro_004321 [Colocasia esculenta]|uniref:Uncharacterized protein n=1 Tax=Colocasia esculenta TaxID=4460 RepID=A0A843TRA7_COLES|nr:hypothetical protein [Colocasia esculenta]
MKTQVRRKKTKNPQVLKVRKSASWRIALMERPGRHYLHLVSTHFISGRHSPPLVSTLTPCQSHLRRGHRSTRWPSSSLNPTGFESISTSSLLHSIPVLLLSFLTLHPLLFHSILLPWHTSRPLAVEQDQGLRQGPFRRMMLLPLKGEPRGAMTLRSSQGFHLPPRQLLREVELLLVEVEGLRTLGGKFWNLLLKSLSSHPPHPLRQLPPHHFVKGRSF